MKTKDLKDLNNYTFNTDREKTVQFAEVTEAAKASVTSGRPYEKEHKRRNTLPITVLIQTENSVIKLTNDVDPGILAKILEKTL